MNRDTTFKEFVEEKGFTFSRLVYGSEEYKSLTKQFNEAKLEVIRRETQEEDKKRSRAPNTNTEED